MVSSSGLDQSHPSLLFPRRPGGPEVTPPGTTCAAASVTWISGSGPGNCEHGSGLNPAFQTPSHRDGSRPHVPCLVLLWPSEVTRIQGAPSLESPVSLKGRVPETRQGRPPLTELAAGSSGLLTNNLSPSIIPSALTPSPPCLAREPGVGLAPLTLLGAWPSLCNLPDLILLRRLLVP